MTMALFPHYRNFAFGTPVIPDLYWNAYSYEERIKKLCCEMFRLIDFTDAMVDLVNDQYVSIEELRLNMPELIDDAVAEEMQRLLDEGTFDPIVTAAIQAWMTEHSAELLQIEEDLQELQDTKVSLTYEGSDTLYPILPTLESMVGLYSLPTGVDEDTLSIGEYTLAEFFEEHNRFTNGFMTAATMPKYDGVTMSAYASSPSSVSAGTYQGHACLNFTASGSTVYVATQSDSFASGNTYMLCYCVLVEDLMNGRVGHQTFINGYQYGASAKWVPVVEVLTKNTAGSTPNYFGCFTKTLGGTTIQPEATVHMRDFFACNLSTLWPDAADIPSYDELYNGYINYVGCIHDNTERRFNYKTDPVGCVSDDYAKGVFVDQMNRKAVELDMERSIFRTASGDPSVVDGKVLNNYSCAYDLMRLGIGCMAYPQTFKAMGTYKHTYQTFAPRLRGLEITNAFFKDRGSGAYSGVHMIYAGKGGKLSGITYAEQSGGLVNGLWIEGICDTNGKWKGDAVISMVGATSSDDIATIRSELSAVALQLIKNQTVTPGATITAMGARATKPAGFAVAIVDGNGPQSVGKVRFDAAVKHWYLNESEVRPAASVSKVLACMVAEDWSAGMGEKIRIVASDIVGSGASSSTFKAGDRVSIRDLVYVGLMLSDNQAVMALSRGIGYHIAQHGMNDLTDL